MRLPMEGEADDNVIVSISDEKPLHMRLCVASTCTRALSLFQSQMRSRSTCDDYEHMTYHDAVEVSISDEKPLHMRLCLNTPYR